MISKKKTYKIATILPYKESYTFDYASAVSLWVSEYYKKSKFRKNNYIFGNTNLGKYLTKNYINIPLNNLKLRFKSTSNEYTEKLIIKALKQKTDFIKTKFNSQLKIINFESDIFINDTKTLYQIS